MPAQPSRVSQIVMSKKFVTLLQQFCHDIAEIAVRRVSLTPRKKDVELCYACSARLVRKELASFPFVPAVLMLPSHCGTS
eukprot:1148926-Pelagomonas_calceolata.AAC.2